MFSQIRSGRWMGIALVFVILGGCGGELSQSERRTDLRNLRAYYVQYCTEKGEPPGRLEDFEDLAEYKTFHSLAEGTWNRLAEGRYEIVWGVDLYDPPGEAGNVRIAWDKVACPDGSRMVLCGDSSIRILSQAEFDAMPAAYAVSNGGQSQE